MTRFAPTSILCPIDLSELSQAALRHGLAWARAFDAKAFVLSARELVLPPRYFTQDQIAALTRQAEAAEEQVHADLEAWVAGLGADGVPVEVLTSPGPADRAILRAIEVVRPGLVVMGTHGRSGANRFLMGSTSEKVVREISVPLLTVREKVAAGAPGQKGPRGLHIGRILCAADIPRDTGAHLAAVADLARALGAQVTVLHSLEVPAWLGAVPSAARDEAEGHLRQLVASFAADLKVKLVLAEGPASERILKQAAGEGVDLIVVGGRRPRGASPVFGSTAIRVMRHAPCPVLALPASAG